MTSQLDSRFAQAELWKEEAEKLREILLGCGLAEELKWRQPCYTFEGKNIAILQRMEDHLSLMFFKGALLKDPKGVLHSPGENSRIARRFEFTSVAEVAKLEKTVKAYVREAIDIEKAGLKVEKSNKLELVEELRKRLAEDRKLREAFSALTPGRRRAYNLYFSEPKQSKTRETRIEKCAARILDGQGLRDR